MSILVKDMRMPTGCLSCDFCNPFVDEPYCKRLMKRTPIETRLNDCPLVEVPKEVKLIINLKNKEKRGNEGENKTGEYADE